MADTKSKKPAGGQGGKSPQSKKPAQNRKPQTKSAEPGSTEASESGGQVAAIVLGAVAAFLLAVIFIEGENIWTVLHNFMFSVFGVCAFVIPVLLIYMCIIYAKGKPLGGAALNIASTGGFVLFLSSIIHLFKNDSEVISAKSVPDQITELWKTAMDGKDCDGGVIGALFGGLLGKLFGKTGAIITLFILMFVAVLLLTGITLPVLASYIKKPVKAIGTQAGRRFEESAQRREEVKAEREEKERLRAEEEERAKAEKGEKSRKLPEKLKNSEKESQKPDNDIFEKDPDYEEPLSEPSMPDIKIPLHSLPADAPKVPTIGGAPATAAAGLSVPSGKSASIDIDYEDISSSSAPESGKAKAEPKPEITAEEIPEKKPVQKPVRKSPPKPVTPVQNESSAEDNTGRKYILPPMSCLRPPEKKSSLSTDSGVEIIKNKLIDTLESFKIKATVTGIVRGPTVTRYELMPDAGVRINKITSLADDIALHLEAQSVRIEAPIPGKAAIGIEIPNDAKSTVSMSEMLDTDAFREACRSSKLSVALGKDITGNIITADLAKMPHLLVAGTTGSGKSVCMNTMIISILFNAKPDEVKFVMIDPKQVEFTIYNGIGHLEVPVVSDARKAAGALGWAVSEMEKRYALLRECQVRDIKGYNKKAENRDDLVKLPHIVIFIDELADLMMVAPKEVEDSICRLAQKARAAGIHLVIATQSPRADVVTGLIRANIASRIALKVSNNMESRIIIDQGGAEKLLGYGDMLFSPVGISKPARIQGGFISDEEIEDVVDHIKNYATAKYNDETMKEIDAKAAASANAGNGFGEGEDDGDDPLDPMFNQAAEIVIQAGQASTTMLQRKLKLGYARASRVMDQLEDNGIVGPSQGAKPREILVSMQDWYERQALAPSGMPKPGNDQMSFSDLNPLPEPEEDTDGEYEEDGNPEDIQSDTDDGPEEDRPEEDRDDEPEEVDDFADIYEDDEDENPEEVPFDIDDSYDGPEEADGFSDIYDDTDASDGGFADDTDDDLLDDDFIDRPIVVEDDFDDDDGPSGFDKYFEDDN